jgi:hypothetical protein
MGMRKDFILKKEERQRKKNRLEENQNMPSSSSSTISNSQPLSQTFDDIDRASFYFSIQAHLMFYF